MNYFSGSIQFTYMEYPSFTVSDGKKEFNIGRVWFMYFEARGPYTIAYSCEGQPYLLSYSIGKIEKMISRPDTFFRCHKSYLINVIWVEWYEPLKNGTCTIYNGPDVPIARRKLKIFKKLRRKMTVS